MKNLSRFQEIKANFNSDIIAKQELAEKIRKNYKVADNFVELKFGTAELQNNFLLYTNSLLVKDVSSNCAEDITILLVKALKDVEFSEHVHVNQSQTIYVKKGKIINMVDSLSFTKGQSYFTSKKNPHKVKYLKGAEVLIVYLPNLEII